MDQNKINNNINNNKNKVLGYKYNNKKIIIKK